MTDIYSIFGFNFEDLRVSLDYKMSSFFFLLLPFSFFFLLPSSYLPSPNLGLTPPGNYKPNARGSDACRGSNSLWTRTLDRYTRAGLPESVVSAMSGPPPKTTQDRIRTKNTHPIPRQKLKFLTPPGIEPGPPGWKAGTLPTTPRRRMITKITNL